MFLNLARNQLSGQLPECGWMNWQSLEVLNLGSNNFSGRLPISMGNLTALQSLILRSNNFSGPLPIESLKNCTKLRVLDASENHFVGNALTQIGQRFASMVILKLHSNKLNGYLPKDICLLSSLLHVLDLADNHFFGNIPDCINNLSAMTSANHSEDNGISYYTEVFISGIDSIIMEGVSLARYGVTCDYSTTLNLVRLMDLSNNNFSGDIPTQITSLKGLWWLNLPHNALTGKIPENIGAMGDIGFIDFSTNWLSGEIPSSITILSKSSLFNVSNNKLTGRIPSSTQLQSLDPSCFGGNSNLHVCSLPMDWMCQFIYQLSIMFLQVIIYVDVHFL